MKDEPARDNEGTAFNFHFQPLYLDLLMKAEGEIEYVD